MVSTRLLGTTCLLVHLASFGEDSRFATMSLQDMSDQRLSQTITQLQAAAASTPYQKNLLSWSVTTTAPPRTASSGTRSTRARTTRAATSTPIEQPPVHHITPIPVAPYPPAVSQYPPPNPIPTSSQGYLSTYPSRLRTGATLLMQPIIAGPQATTVRASRRGGAINYADPGSGDDLPDAGALDSDDSDFVHENRLGNRQRTTRTRMAPGMSVFNSNTGVTTVQPAPPPPPLRPEKAELDQSYLGTVPPARFITAKVVGLTAHVHHAPEALEREGAHRSALVPIRVEFETETHRIRDCFVWNLNEQLIQPENFARIFCTDLDLPAVPWVETVTNQIRAQLEEHEAIARLELTNDGFDDEGEEVPECRVILSIDVQIANHHLLDHIEWDLLSPLTPEDFAKTLCCELGLTGEAVPLIAHAIHEELMKHKKDAVEWGVVDGGGMRDKTGLGLGSVARGRGPKPLESVWRDWQEADEFRTRFEVLSAEEVERREIERERASRRLRRETSKFQSARRRRY
ncbi:SNF5-domain-containing protein [Mycena venus]|uniref:SNF5-domain-containing protein n=1 Tax=Mycena venus TaxID=2733690 RepID=A0A8H6YPE9_9AGAR|nr:SNF5-domain-containing protein [Mycena venus]